MKTLLFITLAFLNLVSFGQDYTKELKKIKSLEQANTFLNDNLKLNGEILELNSGTDSTELSKKVFKAKSGSVFTENGYTYKVVETRPAFLLRVNYIYLDAAKLSMPQIDSTRRVILTKYKEGVTFQDLAKAYNMDGNPNCDLGWISEGLLDKEFTSEFKKHKKGDIFTIDVLGKMWYYVTLKTADDRKVKVYSVLKIKSSN